MTFIMTSLLGTMLGFMVKFLINSFSFSKKNRGGKILLPVLEIVMVLANVAIFALTLGWLIIMFKDVLFNFDGLWLANQFNGKYMFVGGGVGSEIPAGFAMYISIFFFVLAWVATGMIYTLKSRRYYEFGSRFWKSY